MALDQCQNAAPVVTETADVAKQGVSDLLQELAGLRARQVKIEMALRDIYASIVDVGLDVNAAPLLPRLEGELSPSAQRFMRSGY